MAIRKQKRPSRRERGAIVRYTKRSPLADDEAEIVQLLGNVFHQGSIFDLEEVGLPEMWGHAFDAEEEC